jgi:asparagine synthase (glutamine-hydrolysing)
LTNQIAFASELSAFAKVFGPAKPNIDGLVDILAFGRPLGAATAFTNYTRVLPGRRLSFTDSLVDAASHEIKLPIPAREASPSQLLEGLEHSVQLCLQSDRHVGLALSGGLDSLLIAALTSRNGFTDISTVSLQVLDTNDGISDIALLQLPGEAWQKWRHATLTFKPADVPSGIRDSIRIYAEPFRMTSVPLYTHLARLAKQQGITVLLTGEGADELFLGYESYRKFFSEPLSSDHKIRQSLNNFACLPIWREWTKEIFGEDALFSAFDRFEKSTENFESLHPVEALRRTEYILSLDPLLQRADHTLMAEGIEGRVPYLHGNVPGIAAAASQEQLINAMTGKILLRHAAHNLIPSYQTSTAKIPFRAPIANWLTGPLKTWAVNKLKNSRPQLESLGMNADALSLLGRKLDCGDKNIAPVVFSILTYADWFDTFSPAVN